MDKYTKMTAREYIETKINKSTYVHHYVAEIIAIKDVLEHLLGNRKLEVVFSVTGVPCIVGIVEGE